MNALTIHIRREFWEHRSLWIAPLVWVSIITLMFTWTIFVAIPNHFSSDGMFIGPDEQTLSQMSEADRQEVKEAIAHARAAKHSGEPDMDRQTAFAFSYLAITGLVTAFTCVVVFFYLIDCLYTERRDRSILFWKSLPISDARVVLSKLAVALVVVPFGAILLAAVMQLVLSVLFWLRFHGTTIGAAVPDWSVVAWFKSQVIALGVGLGGVLWYAPIAGYLLLVSSWARRNVFLWAILPPIAIAVLEGFFFHSTHWLAFLGQRFGGYVQKLNLDTASLSVGVRDGATDMPRVTDVLSQLKMSGMFFNVEVWIGLAAAAAMVFVAIRLRRYRDES